MRLLPLPLILFSRVPSKAIPVALMPALFSRIPPLDLARPLTGTQSREPARVLRAQVESKALVLAAFHRSNTQPRAPSHRYTSAIYGESECRTCQAGRFAVDLDLEFRQPR